MSEHNNAAYNWGSVSGGCGERDSGCQNTTMQPTTGGVFQVDVERETVGVRTQQCSLQLGECVRWMWRDSGCQNTTMQPTTGGVCQVDVERETVGVRTQQCSLQLGECVRWMWRERQWVSEHNNAAYNWGSVSGGCGKGDSGCQNTTMQPTTGGVSGGCGEKDSRCQNTTMQPTTGGVCQVDVERDSGCQTTTMQPTTGGVSGVCGERDSGCQNTTMQPTTGGVCQVDVERETVGVRTQQCSLQLGECVRWMWRERQWVSEHNNAAYNWGSVSGGCGERDSRCQNTTMQPTTGGVCQVDVERETVGVRTQQCSLQLGECLRWMWRETVGVRTQQCSLQLGECVRWMWREKDSRCQNTTMQPTTGGVCQVDVERETVGVRTQQCSLQLGECFRWMWRERQWVSEHNNAAYNWGSVSGGCGETVGVRTQQCSLQLGECVRWMWRERQWVSEHNNAAYNWGSVSGGCGERDSGCQNTTMQPTTGGVCQVDVERETVGVRTQQCSLQLGVCQVDVERKTVGVRTQQCSLQLGECVRWMWKGRQWVLEHNNAAYNWGSVSGGCGERVGVRTQEGRWDRARENSKRARWDVNWE